MLLQWRVKGNDVTNSFVIHNVSSWAEGDYREMEHTAEILKNANNTIANAYRLKTGKEQDELLSLMNKETWMTAQKAKELGFIDEVMFEDIQLAASTSYSGLLPPEVIAKMRNTIKNPVQNELDILISKLNYLKLKGEKEDE